MFDIIPKKKTASPEFYAPHTFGNSEVNEAAHDLGGGSRQLDTLDLVTG